MTAQSTQFFLVGHSLADYTQIFALSDADLQKSIIDYGSGSSSFNSEMFHQGKTVISFDKNYALKRDALESRINDNVQIMLEGAKSHQDKFVWDQINSVESLDEQRRSNIQKFWDDFSDGSKSGRYRSEKASDFTFQDAQFDLALCSHYLFAHCEEQTVSFHMRIIQSLCRVAKELRIFPLLDNEGEISPLVGPVMLELQTQGYAVEIKEVSFEFQKGGNAMLRVWAETCSL